MSPQNKAVNLSKTLYTRGLQCHKSLYLHKYRPELRSEPSAALEALWKSGHEVGDYAQHLFPGGVIVPFDGLTGEQQLAKTQEEIERGTKVIYEGTFAFDGVFVKADILVCSRGYWNLYEVKSTTSVKEQHLDDVAIQYYVLAGCGLPLHKAFLVHLDNSYVRKGEIVTEELFVLQDLTAEVREKQASIPETLAGMREMLRGKEPDIDIGPHCESPYECDFKSHCWQHVPEPSIFDIRGRGIDKWELYRKGVVNLADVPLSALNAAQRMQVEYFLGRKEHADSGKVREFLDQLSYPLCFLDFETFNSGIPLFDGTRPYQQIPFQYSLHRIDAVGEKARHFECLIGPGGDPRKEIAQRLVNEIPEGACVVAYNMGFEKRVLNEMGALFPKLRKRLSAIADGLIDLMEPFRRRDIYHWEMNGSYSLKNVLPTLVPEMAYEGLEISDGEMASEAYFRMGEISDPAELAKLRKALLEYCGQDTLGLVRLLEKLRSMEAVDAKG